MRILLIASSAREHAVADAFSRSLRKPEIIALCANKNPGLEKLSARLHIGNIMDFDWVLKIAEEERPDFCFIGPDDPIGAGLADVLEERGIPCVAPKKSLARIESSKGFTRELLEKYNIHASPKFHNFSIDRTSDSELDEGVTQVNNFITKELGDNYVVKYDALKGGKGVKVSGEHLHSIEEGTRYAKECLEECGKVVIEEKLVGVEFSLLSFVSGKSVVHMPAVQDHKRAHEGDTGPNTGGMGTVSDSNHSLPFLSEDDIERAKEINRLTAAALFRECAEPYKGILYGGFMAVKDGVRVIEYNARFGDPEALNILPLLQSDLVSVCERILDETLSEEDVRFLKKATVCKYITPVGYPEAKDQKGQPVVFPEESPDARIFFGDVTKDAEGNILLGGSRSAGIVGIADTIEEAEKKATELCEKVQGPIRFRKDIGTNALIQQRIDLLKQIRDQ